MCLMAFTTVRQGLSWAFTILSSHIKRVYEVVAAAFVYHVYQFFTDCSCYWCQVSHVGRFRAPGQGLLVGFCVGDHEKW